MRERKGYQQKHQKIFQNPSTKLSKMYQTINQIFKCKKSSQIGPRSAKRSKRSSGLMKTASDLPPNGSHNVRISWKKRFRWAGDHTRSSPEGAANLPFRIPSRAEAVRSVRREVVAASRKLESSAGASIARHVRFRLRLRRTSSRYFGRIASRRYLNAFELYLLRITVLQLHSEK